MENLLLDMWNIHWSGDQTYTSMYVRMQEDFLNQCLRSRGYVYKNQIYEALSIEWDVKKENTVITGKNCKRIILDQTTIEDKNGSYAVLIKVIFLKN